MLDCVDAGTLDEPMAAEGRHAFAGFIGPRTLLAQVRNTAPYLLPRPPAEARREVYELAHHPHGWRLILQQSATVVATQLPSPRQITNYFALCLSAHYATVSTYIPTDVDSKIRNHLWNLQADPDELVNMSTVALQCGSWDVRRVSRRLVNAGAHGLISGYDGERLSVLAAGMLALLRANDHKGAGLLESAIDAELRRESTIFDLCVQSRSYDNDLLRVAAIITHNVGDLDQGLQARFGKRVGWVEKLRFGRLAHERLQRYGGTFARAAAIYKAVMAAEGHRHYPLRELKQLRPEPLLLLPISPFLDEWGASLARYPRWDVATRAEVVATLIAATVKLKNQVGYFRALAGFEGTYPRGIAAPELMACYPASSRKILRSTTFRRALALPQKSFESSLQKRARAILTTNF